MKIPIEVTNFLASITPLINRVVEIAEPSLTRTSEKHGGSFVYRLKTPESTTEKLYKGGIGKAFISLDDLFAGTIILPSKEPMEAVILDIEKSFRTRDKICHRVVQPTKFEYDDVHLILSIKPERYEVEGPIHQLCFEIQIKTFLQYAIAKATHDILYKGGKQTTRQIRFAAQLRALLEMAEGLMGNIDIADKLVDFSENPEIELRGVIVDFIKNTWEPVDRPADLRRAAITVQNYLNLSDVSFDEFIASLDKYKSILELRSIGPILSTLAVLLNINSNVLLQRATKQKVFFLIPNEAEDLLPILKKIPKELRIDLDTGF